MNTSLQYVGVLSPFDLLQTSLKREVFFFDSIAIPNIKNEFFLNAHFTRCPIRSITHLIKKGIVSDPVEDYLGIEVYLKQIGKDLYDNRLKEIEAKDATFSGQIKKINLPRLPPNCPPFQLLSYPWSDAFTQWGLTVAKNWGIPIQKFGASLELFRNQVDYDRRRLAQDLRSKYNINAYPIYSKDITLMDDFIDGKEDMVSVVIQFLPEPDFENTPWEQILDFKENEESKRLLGYLRNWTNKISNKQITFCEINEELEYHCQKYEEFIKTQKAKVNYGTFETLLMIPAQMLEGIIRLRPTETVKALFEFKYRRLKLNETEIEAPGRDLAYLIRARQEFGTEE